MAYIGRGIDKLSNIEKLDVITFDGSSSYSLTKGSVAFTPSSANSLQVSIDGVVQAGNFTVSGSTIDFGVAIPSTSTNDFIFHYGTGLITTPADGTVGLAQLSATGTKDSTTFLRGDNTFAEAGGGKVLQVVSTTKTDTFTISTANSSAPADITGLSATITPASTSNKILILAQITVGGTTSHTNLVIDRGGTDIAKGDAAGSRQQLTTAELVTSGGNYGSANINFLDSPSSTSALTYKIQANNNGSTTYINRSGTDSDSNAYSRHISTITLMEIAG